MFSENIPVFVPLTGARQSQGKPRSKKAGPRTWPSAEGGVNRPQAKGSRARPRQKPQSQGAKRLGHPEAKDYDKAGGPGFPPLYFISRCTGGNSEGSQPEPPTWGGAHYGSPIKTQGGDKPTGK